MFYQDSRGNVGEAIVVNLVIKIACLVNMRLIDRYCL